MQAPSLPLDQEQRLGLGPGSFFPWVAGTQSGTQEGAGDTGVYVQPVAGWSLELSSTFFSVLA